MKYTATIEIEATGSFTDQDVTDFIKSELGYGAGMNLDNPFIDSDSDAELEIKDIDVTPDYQNNYDEDN